MAAQLLRRWRYWWLQLLWGGLVLLGVWGAVAGAHTLYVPYVAADKKQWTELALYNPGEVEVGLFATAYDTARNESGFSQEASGVPSGRNIFYVPYVTAEEPWWTSLSLFNAGSAEAEVVAVAYDGEGNELGRGSSIVLKPNGRWTGRVQALFSAPLTGLVASLHLELLTGSLQGNVFLGTQDGRQLGSFPLQEAGHSRLAFPLPSPDRPTGMVLILKNLEEGSNALALRLLERDGREMSETTVLLSPLGSAVGPLEDFFGEMLSPEAASLLVMGERPFVALGLVGDPSQGELTVVEGFPLP